jgi:acetyl-CoA carboxylase/biotin carboxylase 1
MASYDLSRVAHFIGGNSLETAPAGRVTDFVREHGGHTVITKVRYENANIETWLTTGIV